MKQLKMTFSIMVKNLCLVLLGLVALSLKTSAQGIVVKELKEVPSGSDAFHAPLDKNGSPCGLLKVRTTAKDLVFDGDLYGEPQNNNNEYLVFLSKGSKDVTIKKSGILPVRLNFPDYGIDAISSKATYVAVLKENSLHPQKNRVIINVHPAQADLFIDGYRIDNDNNGAYQLLIPKGEHVLKAEKEGYRPQVSIVESGKREQVMNVELESLLADFEVNCLTSEAEIYIGDELKGKGHWSGKLAPGNYKVKVCLNGFDSQQKEISLLEKDNKKVTFNKLSRSMTSLRVVSDPKDCEIYIDGIYKGLSSSIISNISTGEHNAEFKHKFGYKPIQRTIDLTSNKDNIVQIVFEPLDEIYKKAFQGNLECIIQLAEKHREGANFDVRTINTNVDTIQSDYWYRKAFEIIQASDDKTFFEHYNSIEFYYSPYSKYFSFEKAMYLYKRYGKVTGEPLYAMIKACYAKIGDWDNAIMYYKKMLENEKYCNGGNYANVARLYVNKGDYETALSWFFKAKEEELKEKRSYLSTNDYAYKVYNITIYGMEIADLYLKMGNTQKAIDLYKQLKGKIVDDPAAKKLKELGY